MSRSAGNVLSGRQLWGIVAATVLASCGTRAGPERARTPDRAARQEQVESHLAPLQIGSTTIFSLSLGDLMRVLGIPGTSVAAAGEDAVPKVRRVRRGPESEPDRTGLDHDQVVLRGREIATPQQAWELLRLG